MLCVLWKLLARHDSLWTSQVYLHGFSPHLPHYRRTHAVLQTWLEKIPQEKWLHECKIYIYSNTSIKREEGWWHALHKCYLYNIMLYIWYLHALCNQRYLDVIMNFAATLWNQRTKIQNAILTVKLLEKIVTVLCHIFLGCCSCRIDLGNMLLTAITSIPAPK